ncbi:MAG: SAM-dependent methyltransferase, partial [Burkholderiales bacterium]|nr:SAM-dependent methyltransferase [Burkholderiales bacterium]
MTRDESIIELGAWLETAPGRYLLEWEQQQLDLAVADAFGFHALQLGQPGIAALRANRMPHRWIASEAAEPADLRCDFDALPFGQHSIDL